MSNKKKMVVLYFVEQYHKKGMDIRLLCGISEKV